MAIYIQPLPPPPLRRPRRRPPQCHVFVCLLSSSYFKYFVHIGFINFRVRLTNFHHFETNFIVFVIKLLLWKYKEKQTMLTNLYAPVPHAPNCIMIVGDHHVWWSYMIIIYDHHIWSWYRMIIYEDVWWSYMMIIYDDHVWWSCMMIAGDHHIWWSYIHTYMMKKLMKISKFDFCFRNVWWPLGYVLASSLVSKKLSGASDDHFFANKTDRSNKK